MSTFFESQVYDEERRVPWSRIDLLGFMRDMARDEKPVRFKVSYRPDVSTRFWFTLKWHGEDGDWLEASAQSLQKCLWRAALRQLNYERNHGTARRAEPEFEI